MAAPHVFILHLHVLSASVIVIKKCLGKLHRSSFAVSDLWCQKGGDTRFQAFYFLCVNKQQLLLLLQVVHLYSWNCNPYKPTRLYYLVSLWDNVSMWYWKTFSPFLSCTITLLCCRNTCIIKGLLTDRHSQCIYLIVHLRPKQNLHKTLNVPIHCHKPQAKAAKHLKLCFTKYFYYGHTHRKTVTLKTCNHKNIELCWFIYIEHQHFLSYRHPYTL